MKTKFIAWFIPVFFMNISLLSAQNKPTIKFNGRIQYDFEFLKRQNADDWQIGSEFRRVYFSAGGSLAENIKYKMEFNFAHSKIDFLDMYIEYSSKDLGNFAIGSKAEPTGLEIGTSSKYIPFFERSMLTSLQNSRWGTGIHYKNTALLNHKAGIQLALTGKGKGKEGFVDKNLEKGINVVARVFIAPVLNKRKKQTFHLGLNYATRPYKDLKFRPENHMGDKYHYVFKDGTRRLETGFEAAMVYKQFSLQAEYKTRKVANRANKDYLITGYYGLASFFITGESRPYKAGAFGRVKPIKDIRKGGSGAFEILVRYSVMDFSPDIVNLPDNAGLPAQINNLAFGLNWYPTSHVRVMYNYVITQDGHPDGNLNAHLIRFHIDF